MKKTINIFLICGAFMLAFISCEDSGSQRIPDTKLAINMRLTVDPDFQFLDGLNIPSAIIRMTLMSELDNIDKVDLYVDYYSFTQDSTYKLALVHTFPGAQINATGFSYDLGSSEISTGVGIAVADMAGGDRLDFTIFTTLKDGTIYPDTVNTTGFQNVTPNILNSSVSTSLTTSFTSFIACPVPAGYMVGNYSWTHTSGPSDPFFGTGPIIAEGNVTINATSPIGRSIGGLSYATFGGGTVNLLLVCNSLLVPYGPAPASCGGGLGWTGDNGNIFVYPDADDSTITLNLLHNPTGDCGLAANDPWVVTLTRL